MKTPHSELRTPHSRRALVAILDQFNISTASFDGLRSDSYEKHIAARSLEELAGLYRTLLEPGGSYEEKRQKCPPWSKGGKHGEKLPDPKTLRVIKHRIMAEQTLEDVEDKMALLRSMVKRLAGVSAPKQTEILDAMLALMNQELLNAKLDGQPIQENLPAVDRLLKVVSLKARVEQGATRNRLVEVIRGGRLKLDREKFRFQVKQATPEPEPAQVDDGPLDDHKTDALIEKVFGKNPYEHDQN